MKTLLTVLLLVTGAALAGDGPRTYSVAWGKKKQKQKSAAATASYNKINGKLSTLLPGSVEKSVDNVERGARKAGVQIVSKKADAISATIKGELADNRDFTIELSGKGFEQTAISIRVAPKGVDLKVVAGDEDASRMLLDFFLREAGVKKRKRFLGIF
jgi:hypothetical protein